MKASRSALNERLSRLEAPLIQKGPVLFLVTSERAEAQELQIKEARDAGLAVIFINPLDAEL